MPPAERRRSSRQSARSAAAPYVKGGSTGLTKYMGDTTLDWGDDDKKEPIDEIARGAAGSRSIFGRKKVPKTKLPPNWKKAKDKDGSIYYFNSVTQQKTHELPPALPAGWREALHKDSGRVYYYQKEKRLSTFDFPTAEQAGDDDDDAFSEAEPPEPPSLIGKVFASFRRGKKKEGLERTATLSKKDQKKADAAKAAKPKDAPDGAQKTVFISCSTLIKEVKLCVGDDHQAKLDALYEKLTNHELPAEAAVKQLMELVGSTAVQQAGLSVMNHQKGVLPHGWLEYIDDASGRPYYFNVHTKVTTWYKPAGVPVPPPPPHDASVEGEVDHGISLDCTLDTHEVLMSGFL